MSEQKFVSPNGDQLAAKIMDGEAVLINLATGMYYSMADSAALVWSMIEQGCSMDLIARSVSDRYGVPIEQAQRDVEQIVRELEEEELAVVSPEGSNPQQPAMLAGVAAPLEYFAPKLEKFSDMAEMFALDPPLPGIVDRN
ncbi:MAG: PqqD family protein [Pseudomonadales bacterium]